MALAVVNASRRGAPEGRCLRHRVGATKYGFNLGAGDNGNVISIANNRDSTRSQSFTYDQVNRILSGQTSTTSGSNCWGEAYSYDQWANLQSLAYVSGYTGCTQEGTWSAPATADNQLPSSAATYDAAGNVLNDNFNIYQWNAESEIKTAAGETYTYDGDGDRLEKSSGKIYWYGAGAEILDESDLSGNFTNEYVLFGGKRIAMRNVSSGTIDYYAEDMLGSSRTIVQAGQTSVCYDADFYPFGGERDVTVSCVPNYKFEGRERDSETQNDDFGARYYSWRVGRWLSADWSAVPAPVPYANLTNPQTLNLYAMVRDNPETFADLDGHNANEGEGSGGDPGYCSGDKAKGVGCQYMLNRDKEFGIVKQQQAQQQNNSQNQQSQQQTQQQKDDQQYHQALQQKEQQIRDQQAGPAVGSPEYIKQLSGQVSAETTAGEKYILAPAAVLEGVGVAVVAAPEVGAAATTTVRAGTEYVLTHPNEPANFAQGLARGPAGAPRTPAGALGAVVNVILKSLIP